MKKLKKSGLQIAREKAEEFLKNNLDIDENTLEFVLSEIDEIYAVNVALPAYEKVSNVLINMNFIENEVEFLKMKLEGKEDTQK
jgi:hypothetical protein